MRSGLVVGTCLLLMLKVAKGLSVRYSTSWWILEAVEWATLAVAFLLIMSRFIRLQGEVEALRGEVNGLKNRLDKIAMALYNYGAEVGRGVIELVRSGG